MQSIYLWEFAQPSHQVCVTLLIAFTYGCRGWCWTLNFFKTTIKSACVFNTHWGKEREVNKICRPVFGAATGVSIWKAHIPYWVAGSCFVSSASATAPCSYMSWEVEDSGSSNGVHFNHLGSSHGIAAYCFQPTFPLAVGGTWDRKNKWKIPFFPVKWNVNLKDFKIETRSHFDKSQYTEAHICVLVSPISSDTQECTTNCHKNGS